MTTNKINDLLDQFGETFETMIALVQASEAGTAMPDVDGFNLEEQIKLASLRHEAVNKQLLAAFEADRR